jgi:putative restriction endonuclease
VRAGRPGPPPGTAQAASGAEIGPRVPESGPWLTGHGAVGRLRPTVEQLLADSGTLAAAARLLLDLHFTPGLSGMICDAVGLDLAVLELAGSTGVVVTRRSVRRSGFAEEVLRAYAYQCAMCGFDGALGRNPVGIEAAHVRWHRSSREPPPKPRSAAASYR